MDRSTLQKFSVAILRIGHQYLGFGKHFYPVASVISHFRTCFAINELSIPGRQTYGQHNILISLTKVEQEFLKAVVMGEKLSMNAATCGAEAMSIPTVK
ncbi:hypothetical protein GDO78_002335 [Eleutherodactylus coqui]|uniref:Uncharacterized protein n=1 Tax=Eleutherodactylus coqui TaxID=57060 RepID=A0A8J6EVP1_ELECQ|nr:hypothetical protein GDO78_002335 [Eleutherodactylus coqui]